MQPVTNKVFAQNRRESNLYLDCYFNFPALPSLLNNPESYCELWMLFLRVETINETAISGNEVEVKTLLPICNEYVTFP